LVKVLLVKVLLLIPAEVELSSEIYKTLQRHDTKVK
jgi:hypothetical protein